jgi:hypothetical protein
MSPPHLHQNHKVVFYDQRVLRTYIMVSLCRSLSYRLFFFFMSVMFHSASLVLLALILQVGAAVSPTSAPPIVDLGYAQYQGTFNSTAGTTEFRSIRYAAPPVGALGHLTFSRNPKFILITGMVCRQASLSSSCVASEPESTRSTDGERRTPTMLAGSSR